MNSDFYHDNEIKSEKEDKLNRTNFINELVDYIKYSFENYAKDRGDVIGILAIGEKIRQPLWSFNH